MKHISISKKNWVRIGTIRKDYSLRNDNEVITVILSALERYTEKYGSIDIDVPKEIINTTVQQEKQ